MGVKGVLQVLPVKIYKSVGKELAMFVHAHKRLAKGDTPLKTPNSGSRAKGQSETTKTPQKSN